MLLTRSWNCWNHSWCQVTNQVHWTNSWAAEEVAILIRHCKKALFPKWTWSRVNFPINMMFTLVNARRQSAILQEVANLNCFISLTTNFESELKRMRHEPFAETNTMNLKQNRCTNKKWTVNMETLLKKCSGPKEHSNSPSRGKLSPLRQFWRKQPYLLTQRQKWDRKPVPLHHHLETVQYMNDFSNDQHNVFLKYLAIRYMELIIKRNSKPYQFI